MTEKDRLIRALNGKEVDRPPCICPGGMMNIVTTEIMDQVGVYWPEAHRDAHSLAQLAEGVNKLTGIENLGVPFCMTVEAEAMGAEVALGTLENEPMIQDYLLKDIAQYKKLKPINNITGRVGAVTEAIELLKIRNPDMPVVANLTGPISLATSLIEPMVFFKEMSKNPGQVHEFLSIITKNMTAFGRMQLLAGAQVLTISEPTGTGEILGPKTFAQFVLPYINRVLDDLKGYYAASIVHICGNIRSIFKEVDQVKAAAISIDSATKLEGLVTALTCKVIVGSVSTHLLLKGKPETIKRASISCLLKGAKILSPACGISPATPIENIRAMVQVVKQ